MASLSPETDTTLDFAPTAAVLEAAIEVVEELGSSSGSALDPATRRAAFERYLASPLPGGRTARSWRYSYDKLAFEDLTWTTGRMRVATMPLSGPAEPTGDDGPALETASAAGLVHIGALAAIAPPAGAADSRVVVMPLAEAYRMHADRLAGVHGQLVDAADRFVALATAFQNCGAFVYVPSGVQLDAPIQLAFLASPATGNAIFPHVVVVLGEGARATVIDRLGGEGDAFVCGTVEVHVGEAAVLDYVSVQQADVSSRVFAARASRCERNGTVRWHAAELGGGLVRTTIDAALGASGVRADISALFFTGGMQHVDLALESDHTVGSTTSSTVVRSAATDRGQGRFIGNIAIRRAAHGSDATLRDDVLLLSKNAHIDSVPALEIAANDVKAFHGATVGSLDEEQLFYARSRGIPKAEALRMIALGFFEPVIARFPGEMLREEIRTALDNKIDDATDLDA